MAWDSWEHTGIALVLFYSGCLETWGWVLMPTQFLSMTSLIRETQSAVFTGRARNTWRLVLLSQHNIAQASAPFSTVAACPEELTSLQMLSYGLQKVTETSRSLVHFKGSSPLQEKLVSQQLRGCEAVVCSPDIQADEVNTIRLLRRTWITIITGVQHIPKRLIILQMPFLPFHSSIVCSLSSNCLSGIFGGGWKTKLTHHRAIKRDIEPV